MKPEPFLIAVFALVLLSACAGAFTWWNGRRRAAATWEGLLARLEPIDRGAVTTIALDLLDENGLPRRDADGDVLDEARVWQLIGGMSGLEALGRNCEVLVEIAAYVQRWHPEAVLVAEQMRLNAREVQFHVDRLKGAARTGNLHAVFADYAERAVAAYYRMTRSVLALYEEVEMPGLQALQRAI